MCFEKETKNTTRTDYDCCERKKKPSDSRHCAQKWRNDNILLNVTNHVRFFGDSPTVRCLSCGNSFFRQCFLSSNGALTGQLTQFSCLFFIIISLSSEMFVRLRSQAIRSTTQKTRTQMTEAKKKPTKILWLFTWLSKHLWYTSFLPCQIDDFFFAWIHFAQVCAFDSFGFEHRKLFIVPVSSSSLTISFVLLYLIAIFFRSVYLITKFLFTLFRGILKVRCERTQKKSSRKTLETKKQLNFMFLLWEIETFPSFASRHDCFQFNKKSWDRKQKRRNKHNFMT